MSFFSDIGDSFDDIGDFFFGEDDPEVPALTPAQQQNLNLSNELLQQQADLSEMLLPILLSEDFDVVVDEETREITSITPKEKTAGELATDEINDLLAQKSLSFLRGEGEIPAEFGRQADLARERTRETLLKNIGPGFATSTPGRDAMARLEAELAGAAEGISFGRLSELEGLRLAGEAGQRATSGNEFQRAIAALGVQSNPLASLNQSRQLTQADRALGLRANITGHDPGLLTAAAPGAGAYFTKWLLT